MRNCEFCLIIFHPRPQVKNPRACPDLLCQKKRQRTNEREWRAAHAKDPDPGYHRIRRRQRISLLQKISRSILECIEVGGRFLNRRYDAAELGQILDELTLRLGIRRANKLCLSDFSKNAEGLGCDP